jgi:hypothetical protein
MAKAKKQTNRIFRRRSITLAAADLVIAAPTIGAPAFVQLNRLKAGRRHELAAKSLTVSSPILGPHDNRPAPAAKRRGWKRAKAGAMIACAYGPAGAPSGSTEKELRRKIASNGKALPFSGRTLMRAAGLAK